MEMDAVDKKQQDEIDAIQKKNDDQDFWIKIMAIGIVGWLMIMTSVMMVRLTQYGYKDIHSIK